MCCEKPLKAIDLRIKSVGRNDAGLLEIGLEDGSSIIAVYPVEALPNENLEAAAKAADGDLKLFVDSSEQINNRRERVNQFYWVISALILTGEFLIAKCVLDYRLSKRSLICAFVLILVSVLGTKVCCLWKRTIDNYGKVSFSKVAILRGLEEFRQSKMFSCQGEVLTKLDYTAQIKLEIENAELLCFVQEGVRAIAAVGTIALFFGFAFHKG
jgi:hypothetical protein